MDFKILNTFSWLLTRQLYRHHNKEILKRIEPFDYLLLFEVEVYLHSKGEIRRKGLFDNGDHL